jgi:Fe-S cluster biosynthesis and repair protein YggX
MSVTIKTFNNVSIKLYNQSWLSPRVMVIDEDKIGVYNLYTLETLNSDLSGERETEILNWVEQHKVSLIKIWRHKLQNRHIQQFFNS